MVLEVAIPKRSILEKIFKLNKLELINEKWKSQDMLSFSIHNKILMNGFMS